MLAPFRARLRRASRPTLVGTVAVLGASLGFLSVLIDDAEPPTGYLPREAPPASAINANAAPTYLEISQKEGAKRSLALASLQHLIDALPNLTDPVVRDPGSRAAALHGRAARRAFDGAPPVIPHAVQERDASSCLVCHERGMVVSGRVAPAVSHRRIASCMQCHVVDTTSQPAPAGPAAVSSKFVAEPFGGRGQRAYEGAPPTMPHRLSMRENCSSCHGVTGREGIRTTHPERLNCQQCHAPVSALQQLPPQPPGLP